MLLTSLELFAENKSSVLFTSVLKPAYNDYGKGK